MLDIYFCLSFGKTGFDEPWPVLSVTSDACSPPYAEVSFCLPCCLCVFSRVRPLRHHLLRREEGPLSSP